MNSIKIPILYFTFIFLIASNIFQTSTIFAQNDELLRRRGIMDEEKELFVQNWHRFEGDSIISEVGYWGWGRCIAVDVRDNYALIGNGPTVHLLDISTPQQPIIVGEYLTDGYVYDIQIKDSVAFVAIGNGLLILNISNPKSPQKISKIVPTNDYFFTQRVVVVDSFAYVSGFPGTIVVIDISNIYLPYSRGWSLMYGEWPECFTLSGKLIFFGGSEVSEVGVIDVTNPDSLKRSHFDIRGYALSGFAKDSILFVGTMSYSGQNHFIKVFKVISPDSGLFLSQIKVDRPINGLKVNGTTLYAVSDSGVVYAIDIADLMNPFIRTRYTPKAYEIHSYMSRGIAFSGKNILIAITTGLLILNSDKQEILKRMCFFPTGGYTRKIVVKEHLAFIASWYSGLWIVDISNPQKPISISNINVGSFTVDIVVDEYKNLLYFVNHARQYPTDSSRGLWIVDISNIKNPKILSHHIGIVKRPPGAFHENSIARMGDYIVITQVGSPQYDSTLEIVDVHNPLEPCQVSIIRSPSLPYRIAIKDSMLYVADADLGLRIIDLHNPLIPIQVDVVPGAAVGIALKDTIAYIFSPYLTAVSVANPFSPSVICTTTIVPSGFISADMAISDHFLHYSGGFYSGIVDISNPNNLILKTSNKWYTPVWTVAANEKLVYYGSKDLGMWIYQNNLITEVSNKPSEESILQFELLQNFPNPFNSTTTIPISLDRKSSLTLTIYDILGRQIETIFKGELGAGKHTFQWSMDSKRKPLESGIYFIVLQADGNRLVRKSLYIK